MRIDRDSELFVRLEATRESVARTCVAAGRAPGDVTIVVVTKTFPASDVISLAHHGVCDFGENRDQEAAPKAQEVAADLASPLRWHFIGQLQTNKCASVARYANLVHSVDRRKLVTALDHAVGSAAKPPLGALVQVNLDPEPEPGRGGASPADVRAIADAIATTENLTFEGVMGVAPHPGDPVAAFERLREIASEISDDHPSAKIISAGMSGDFAAAIQAGATHVRLGAAILGERPPLT